MDDGFHISEQIDKHDGSQISAENLTWSYANVLTALKRREMLVGKGKTCQWLDLFSDINEFWKTNINYD